MAAASCNGNVGGSHNASNIVDSDSSDSEVQIIKELKTSLVPHKCDLCCEGEFLISRLLHFGGVLDEKHKFACDECDRGFTLKSSLTNHMKKHSKTETNSQDLPNSTNLSQSLNSSVSSTTSYSCTICSRFYKTEKSLRSHNRKKHDLRRHV